MENQNETKLETVETHELEKLRSTREAVLNARNGLADLLILEERCKNDRARLMFDYNKSSVEFQDIQKAITERYGEISVDLQTGVITHHGTD